MASQLAPKCPTEVASNGTTFFAAFFQGLFEHKLTPADTIQSSKNFFNSCPPAVKELLKKACNDFYAVSDKNKDEGVFGNMFCCKANEICFPPFYTQIWFFAACGGFVLLLIIIILVVIICCSKK
ncbi:hypothetical protein B9Z55_007978 [Caenorhabditis nigoni]|uniref:Uncharacterized protein n=1 Tax=Caenorhabditis nigoni TaxID=1611254 RepID=A0A2G5VC26_9PELO|nr:hypothetical protein B9Z55_007978 [Caenorhabditis nigoni]